MKTFYPFIILFFGSLTLMAGEHPSWLWANSAASSGGDAVSSGICIDAQGNLYITGSFYGPSLTFGNDSLVNEGLGNFFVAKYTASGNLLWTTSAGGDYYAIANGITTDVNGNVYVTGGFSSDTVILGNDTFYNAGSENIFIIKYDPSGNVLWAKTAGGAMSDVANGISTDLNGNVYITGGFSSPIIAFDSIALTNSGASNIFTAKYNSSGQIQWAESAGGTLTDAGNSLSTDATGSIYVTGGFSSTGVTFGSTLLTNAGEENIFIAKYDSIGNVQWAKSAGGTLYDISNSISADANGNTYITGSYSSLAINFGSISLTNASVDTGKNIFIARYDSSGNVHWAKSAGGVLEDVGNGINANANGNIYVTGAFSSPVIAFGNDTLINEDSSSQYNDIFVAKYDSSGNLVWLQSAGGLNDDAGNSLCTDASGDVFLTGNYDSPVVDLGNTILTDVSGFNNVFIAELDTVLTTGVVNVHTDASFINVYPNPTTGNIYFNGVQYGYTLQVYNVLGDEIAISSIAGNNYSINLSNKAKGIYFYRITDANNLVHQGKVILQ